MGYLISVQETIKKQCEETIRITKENVKLQVIVVENGSLNKTVAKLEDECE